MTSERTFRQVFHELSGGHDEDSLDADRLLGFLPEGLFAKHRLGAAHPARVVCAVCARGDRAAAPPLRWTLNCALPELLTPSPDALLDGFLRQPVAPSHANHLDADGHLSTLLTVEIRLPPQTLKSPAWWANFAHVFERHAQDAPPVAGLFLELNAVKELVGTTYDRVDWAASGVRSEDARLMLALGALVPSILEQKSRLLYNAVTPGGRQTLLDALVFCLRRVDLCSRLDYAERAADDAAADALLASDALGLWLDAFLQTTRLSALGRRPPRRNTRFLHVFHRLLSGLRPAHLQDFHHYFAALLLVSLVHSQARRLLRSFAPHRDHDYDRDDPDSDDDDDAQQQLLEQQRVGPDPEEEEDPEEEDSEEDSDGPAGDRDLVLRDVYCLALHQYYLFSTPRVRYTSAARQASSYCFRAQAVLARYRLRAVDFADLPVTPDRTELRKMLVSYYDAMPSTLLAPLANRLFYYRVAWSASKHAITVRAPPPPLHEHLRRLDRRAPGLHRNVLVKTMVRIPDYFRLGHLWPVYVPRRDPLAPLMRALRLPVDPHPAFVYSVFVRSAMHDVRVLRDRDWPTSYALVPRSVAALDALDELVDDACRFLALLHGVSQTRLRQELLDRMLQVRVLPVAHGASFYARQTAGLLLNVAFAVARADLCPPAESRGLADSAHALPLHEMSLVTLLLWLLFVVYPQYVSQGVQADDARGGRDYPALHALFRETCALSRSPSQQLPAPYVATDDDPVALSRLPRAHLYAEDLEERLRRWLQATFELSSASCASLLSALLPQLEVQLPYALHSLERLDPRSRRDYPRRPTVYGTFFCLEHMLVNRRDDADHDKFHVGPVVVGERLDESPVTLLDHLQVNPFSAQPPAAHRRWMRFRSDATVAIEPGPTRVFADLAEYRRAVEEDARGPPERSLFLYARGQPLRSHAFALLEEAPQQQQDVTTEEEEEDAEGPQATAARELERHLATVERVYSSAYTLPAVDSRQQWPARPQTLFGPLALSSR